AQGDVRAGEPRRRDAALVVAGPPGAVDPHRRRRGDGPRDHRGLRPARRVPYCERILDPPVAGLRVGVPENYYFDGVTDEMAAAVHAAARAIGALGTVVTQVRLPDPRALVDVCNVISRSESATIHSRVLRDRPHELQPAVRARLETGFHISAHDYLEALLLRGRLTREFVREVFGEVDALVLPVIPEPAPALEAV